MCLNTQISLQYNHHKRATELIVTILIDINACNNNLSGGRVGSKQTGGSGHISSGGMTSTDVILFSFTVFGFFGYLFVFCFFLGTMLLLYVFKNFWSRTSQGTTGRQISPPFLVREFLFLTRIKSYSRESGKLLRSELPFRSGGKGLVLSIRSARSAR